MKKRYCIAIIFIFTLLGALCAYADVAPHDGYVVKLKPTIGLMNSSQNCNDVIKIDSLSDIPKYIDESDIEYIEPNYYMDLFALTDDPDYWQYQKNMQLINAPNVWETGCVGQNVKIAVIDSGVNAVEDLKANLLPGYSFVDEDTTDTSDINGHGTFVSGIIAAEANNNIQIAGLAYRAKVVPLKCFEKLAGTSELKATVEDISNAIKMAVDTFDCDVINLSLGMKSTSSLLKEAVDYALSRGVIVVAACGNETDSTVNYPASYSGVISVGSVDNDKKWKTNRNGYVDVGAPGHDVYSLSKDGKLAQGSGSSFAAPIVSALAAVCLNIREDITAAEFETLIKETGEKLVDDSFSFSLVNAQAMIRKILEGKEVFVSPYYYDGDELSATVYNNTMSQLTVFGVICSDNEKKLKQLTMLCECGMGINVGNADDKITTYIWKTNLCPIFKREN